ncbi:NifU family protein [Bartonella sp. TP]|uniref:NifU family protein n=1 Tax=Bartonella sp. TP TaxID=3057550 RepID=UPI0025B20806|nr:NifU family protein [Bartonella sp. TP]MDN5249210.1 NifU family protein [Alphaproteobacteria bacterium]MDN5249382.1 NifU family protein [Alphaproteobacteria bacterium]WJW80297.1 NifU family protein [Bartonella sp. TP]
MFIQTQETPNPNTLKFFPGRLISKDKIVEYKTEEEAKTSSPLAAQLFNIQGVSSILFATDFIAISKSNCEWKHIKPAILAVILEYFLSNENVYAENQAAPAAISANNDEEFFEEKDKEIVNCIKELLASHIRDAVARDGGDITFRGYRDGTVYLKMHGACSGCPSASATLKQGVENLLKHFIPQLKQVQQV